MTKCLRCSELSQRVEELTKERVIVLGTPVQSGPQKVRREYRKTSTFDKSTVDMRILFEVMAPEEGALRGLVCVARTETAQEAHKEYDIAVKRFKVAEIHEIHVTRALIFPPQKK